ncbi:MAG: UbiA prenyltransferase family protein [Clostridium sp.]|nr:UbiA prenyltransferase family protein [Clostridium sp.]
MKNYLKMFRISHWAKNVLIFTPIFFAKIFFDLKKLWMLIYMTMPFCLVASIIYIINDIKDVEKDREHPTKCNRPIASGVISIKAAKVTVCILMLIVGGMLIITACVNAFNLTAVILLFLFFIINMGYSNGLKNVPILDITLLSAGYLIRVFYGASIAEVEVSSWLYLTVMTGAFYLGMGKRRNELKKITDANTRSVLQKYNYEFLDKNMHVCVGLAITFYALWAIQTNYSGMIWTVPLVMIILMKYSLDVENDKSEGDPMGVILGDKTLIALVALYVAIVFAIIYVVKV